MAGLPPPPVNDKPGSFTWLEWYRQLRNYVSESGSVPWYIINFAGSSLTDIADRPHNNLQNLQGGATGEMYHLTAAEYAALTAGNHNDLNGKQGGTTNEYYHLRQTDYDMFDHMGNLVVPKTAGYGIKVDTSTPTFGWKDLLGELRPKTSGVGSPQLSNLRGGNVRAYSFAAGDDYDGSFHMPHDWVPGTDIYLHVHWSHNGTAISGNLVLTWSLTYAKGHNQTTFPAETTNTQTIPVANITTYPRYGHFIEEIQISTAGGSGTQLNTNNLEPDGLIMFHMDATTIPTITGGSPNQPFVLFIDLHYQATNVTTKNKAPNFYA